MKIYYYNNLNDFAKSSAELIFKLIQATLAKKEFCSVVLSGGESPLSVYRHLTKLLLESKLDLKRIYWFLGDERYAAIDSPKRNALQIEQALLSAFKSAKDNTFFWQAKPFSVLEIALDYQAKLKKYFSNLKPQMDICLLGLGEDGHTASLFKDAYILQADGSLSPLKAKSQNWTLAIYRPLLDDFRLSLSPFLLKKCRYQIFLISGKNKKDAFGRFRKNDSTLPANWVKNRRAFICINLEAFAL